MTVDNMKQAIFKLTEEYFLNIPNTEITTNIARTKKVASYNAAILTFMDIQTQTRPARFNQSGLTGDFLPATTTVQLDLFCANAVQLLANFVQYLNSPAIDIFCQVHNIDIITSTIRDLTDIVAETTYRPRAMTELEIAFILENITDNGHFERVDLSWQTTKNTQ
ncbi:MAG: hypothetical protein FWG64_05555 [Firmicutes bacterium]|nr:hypothetical protein [Bacillota bacterium]